MERSLRMPSSRLAFIIEVYSNHSLVEVHTRYKTWSWSRSRSEEAITLRSTPSWIFTLKNWIRSCFVTGAFVVRTRFRIHSGFKNFYSAEQIQKVVDSIVCRLHRLNTFMDCFFVYFSAVLIFPSWLQSDPQSRRSLTFLCHFLRLSPS